MADDKPNPCDQQDEERKVRLKRWTQEILRFHQTPEEIASGLRLHVIGQGEGVRAVAALLRRQMRRLQRAIERNPDRVWPGPPGESTPTLLIGPTGCGKTLLVRTLAKIAGLPYVIEDATSMSETGYYGRSVHNMLEQLASRADPLISMTQATHGIAAIDEVDKVARRPGGRASGTIDVSREGVQRSLLALLDGSVMQIEWPPGASAGVRTYVPFPTAGLMLILMGAFEGLDEIVRRRLRGRRSMGFGAPVETSEASQRHDILRHVVPDDLVAFGIMPELVGRLRDVVVMQALSRDDLRRILVEAPEGPLAVVQRAAALERFRFSLSDRLVEAILDEAMATGLGARALHAIVTRLTRGVFFAVPGRISPEADDEYVVTLDMEALGDPTCFGIEYRQVQEKAGRRRRRTGIVVPDDLEAEA